MRLSCRGAVAWLRLPPGRNDGRTVRACRRYISSTPHALSASANASYNLRPVAAATPISSPSSNVDSSRDSSHSSSSDRQRHHPHRRRSQLDLFAHFKPPPPPRTPLQQVLSSSPPDEPRTRTGDNDEAFETSSTAPAGTSFQDVPKPISTSSSIRDGSTVQATTLGSKVVEPVPAMKASTTSAPAFALAGDKDIGTGAGTGPNQGVRTKEIAVQGVMVPPKPIPPGEEDCCMSGCVHCVYTIYADDLETYSDAIVRARTALSEAGIPQDQWPLQDELVTLDDTDDVQAKNKIVIEETKKVESGMDPSLSAFLALENKLKKKQAPESSAAS
ncbi:hypothetical protein I317_00269 [Kwoniella heveanensis CBS 569]|nr:hypothetical protein I317_00269 [Kwoniella heveanensis CBS 569]